jgi:hypothetical protein
VGPREALELGLDIEEATVLPVGRRLVVQAGDRPVGGLDDAPEVGPVA